MPMPIPKPAAEEDEGYEEFFKSVSAQNESMDAFMNCLPTLRAGDSGMLGNGMQGYTIRQSDAGNDCASTSTLEHLYFPPQFANLREEWEAAKEDDDLSTESGDWVELNDRTHNKDQEAAENVDKDGVVVQALPPARAATGCGLGAGPGAQFDNFCNPEEEGHGESPAEGGGPVSSQPYVPTLLQGGSRTRRRTLPLLSKSPSDSPPSKQQPAAAMSPEAAAVVHAMADSVSTQQPASNTLPEAAAAAAAATAAPPPPPPPAPATAAAHAKADTVSKPQPAAVSMPEAAAEAAVHAKADDVQTLPAPPAQTAQSVSTLHDEIRLIHLDSKARDVPISRTANTCSPPTARAPTGSGRLLQQGKEGEVAAVPCSPAVQGEGDLEALDCSVPEPEGEHPHALMKQLPGGLVCILPGACNTSALQPQLVLEHELDQDDHEMLQDLGLSPSAAASSKLEEDSKADFQEATSGQNEPADPDSSMSQVEAFSLDKDFDYDNCKLTPRGWPYNRIRHGPAPISRQESG